jgi:hypothetical protein
MPMPVARTQFNNNGTVNPSYWDYKPRGQSGIEVSELFPKLAACADDLCLVRSMTSKFSEHAQGNLFMHTGFPFIGYPSAGAWTSYGLGTDAEDLPGYIVLRAGDAGIPHGGLGNFGNGFLPATHQASVLLADSPEPLRNIRPHDGAEAQRRQLDFIGTLDRDFVQTIGADPHVETAIRNAELAWRMQSSVPSLCDISGESPATLALYGVNDPEPKKAAYARECLVARRLVERGVRFVQLYHTEWDHHADIGQPLDQACKEIDQPTAALIKDLKRRGLLDSTLVIWGGEFGRTPMAEGRELGTKFGRNHHIDGFTMFMAGAGVKPGTQVGETDELGFSSVGEHIDVHDIHATLLHLLGIEHTKLTYTFQGRPFRLTDVSGRAIKNILS